MPKSWVPRPAWTCARIGGVSNDSRPWFQGARACFGSTPPMSRPSPRLARPRPGVMGPGTHQQHLSCSSSSTADTLLACILCRRSPWGSGRCVVAAGFVVLPHGAPEPLFPDRCTGGASDWTPRASHSPAAEHAESMYIRHSWPDLLGALPRPWGQSDQPHSRPTDSRQSTHRDNHQFLNPLAGIITTLRTIMMTSEPTDIKGLQSLVRSRPDDRPSHLGAASDPHTTPYDVTRVSDASDWLRHFRTTPDQARARAVVIETASCMSHITLDELQC